VVSLKVDPEPVPLTIGEDGVVRVGRTRVTLDTVVAAFDEGATPEEIAQRYPTLDLPDVYSVVTYYLKHPEDVRDYLIARQRDSERVRRDNERRYPPLGVRERLLKRRENSFR
jgi:uncharacterized protein (DUF433 family)